MSYILDGLKKAEKERQLESVPDLQTNHSPYPGKTYSGKTAHRYIKAGSVILLLAVAAASLYLLKEPSPVSKEIAEESPTALPADTTLDAPDQAHVISADTTPEESEPVPALPANTALEESEPPPALSDAPRQTVKIQPLTVLSSREEDTKSPAAGKAPENSLPILSGSDILEASPSKESAQPVPLLAGMDKEFKSRIPEINYAGHTYSETPGHRLIIINNKIMKEGQRIEDNLKLIEITWEGVILDYQGTRFRMNIAQN